MNGHEAVFWGFLDDIYHFYNHKVSPYDRRFQGLNPEKKRTATSVTRSQISKQESTYKHITFHKDDIKVQKNATPTKGKRLKSA